MSVSNWDTHCDYAIVPVRQGVKMFGLVCFQNVLSTMGFNEDKIIISLYNFVVNATTITGIFFFVFVFPMEERFLYFLPSQIKNGVFDVYKGKKKLL